MEAEMAHLTSRDRCHTPYRWGLLDAVVAIVLGLTTILLLVFRHPFRLMSLVIIVAMVGTVAGWWTP
jgi:hypothetical protein